MALKVDRIIEDLSDSNVEIQLLALTTVPRLSPEIAIEPAEMEALYSRLRLLASLDNPDVVFLARKAQNFLASRGAAPVSPAGQAAAAKQFEVGAEKRGKKAGRESASALPVPESVPPAPTPIEAVSARQETTAAGLLAELKGQNDPGRIASLLTALRQLKAPEALSEVEGFLSPPDPRVRANAD
jgi:hypothetical protein